MSTIKVNNVEAAVNVQTAAINGGPLAGFRNRVQNGDMRVAQRGVSFTAANGPTLDRWGANLSGGMAWTVTQSTDVPSAEFGRSLKVEVTTAKATLATNDYQIIEERIEGYDVADLVGRDFTVSFWFKTSKTGDYSLYLRNKGNATVDRSYAAVFTVATANVWQKYTVTVTGGLPTTGTWDFATGIGLRLGITTGCGGDYMTGELRSWVTGDRIAGTTQTNLMSTVGNTAFLTGVQLEVGKTATSFEFRSYGVELNLCRRYYIASSVSARQPVFVTYTPNGDTRGWWEFPTTMRASPTIAFNNTTWVVVGCGATADVTNVTVQVGAANQSPEGFGIALSGFANLQSAGTIVAWGSSTSVNYTANAEL